MRDFDEVLPPIGDPDRFRVAAQHEVEAGRELFTLIDDPSSNSIWFNEFISGRIGRFDIATETITEEDYGIAPTSGPLFVVRASDDHIWFTQVSLLETVPGESRGSASKRTTAELRAGYSSRPAVPTKRSSGSANSTLKLVKLPYARVM